MTRSTNGKDNPFRYASVLFAIINGYSITSFFDFVNAGAMIVFPNCKINLGLHILQKRADGFHDLETVFYPLPLQDALEAVQNGSTAPAELTTSGLEIDGAAPNNSCVKACQLLQKDFPHLPSLQLHLHKVIPMGAGLGGGSADGAFTLLLLNKKYNLGLTENQLLHYALQVGSDCPFFIINKPCFASGRGEMLSPIELDLSTYKIIIVYPNIHISTAWAFSQVQPNNKRTALKEIIQQPVAEWKSSLENDFERPILAHYPALQMIKEQLYEQGAFYAALTGSGSTFFGLFSKEASPELAFPAHYFVKTIV